MTKLSYETRIEAPVEQVWDVLSDFAGVWRYSPTVTKSHSTNETDTGVGAERHCDLAFAGTSVEERIVDWQEGRSMDIEIIGGEKMPPIKNVLGHFEVEPDGEGTIVRGSMRYDTKLGPVGWVADRVIVRRKFGNAFGLIFAGLKHYVETGETVTTDVQLDETVVRALAA